MIRQSSSRRTTRWRGSPRDVRPMLAELADPATHERILAKTDLVFEPKYDGMRAPGSAKGTDQRALSLEIDSPNEPNGEKWSDVAPMVSSRLANLLSDKYLESMRGPVNYGVKNPWFIAPTPKRGDWLLTARSKHCGVTTKRSELIRRDADGI